MRGSWDNVPKRYLLRLVVASYTGGDSFSAMTAGEVDLQCAALSDISLHRLSDGFAPLDTVLKVQTGV